MNIALFTDDFLPKYDGIVSAIVSFSEEAVRQGHHLILFVPKPGKDKHITLSHPHIEIVAIPAIPAMLYPDLRISSPAILPIISRIRDFKPDIIHFHTPGPLGIISIIVSKVLGIPLVSTFHTYFMEPEYLRLIKMDRFQKVSNVLWKVSNFVYDRARVTICPSTYTAIHLKRQGLKSPTIVIPNGIELPKNVHISDARLHILRRKYACRRYNLLYVGRVSKEKNLDILIRAFSLVHKKLPDSRLYMIGDGPYLSHLKAFAAAQRLSEDVQFFGAINHKALLQSGIYQICDLFITPSTSETQCISAIEAMSFGMPLIVARAKGIEELISGNGLALSPVTPKTFADAAVSVLLNPRLKHTMSEKSQELSKNYNIRITTEKIIDQYKNVIASSQ